MKQTCIRLMVIASAATVMLGTAVADTVRLSEPVAVDEKYETFGELLPQDGQELSLAELLTGGDEYLGQTVIVTARVSQVCQKKGCFFIAKDGSHVARVSFTDYSFFVPTDISGKTVRLAGQLVRKDVTAEQAEHYNDDMAAHGGVTPGSQFEIVASAVRVPR